MKKPVKILFGVLFFFLLAGLAIYLVTWGNYAVPKTLPDDKSIPRISAGDRIFHGETFGNRTSPPLIVLHGGPGGDYRNLLPLKKLADRYFIIFYDQAGSGLSPRQNPGTINLNSTLSDLNLIIDKYSKERRINIIGHSWGAMLAAAYTGRHPEKVDHLILAEPGFLTTEKAQEFIYKTRPSMTPGAIWFLIKTWFESLHISDHSSHDRYDYIMARMVTGFDSPDHPLSGYFCEGEPSPLAKIFWRFGFIAWQDILSSGMDESGNITTSFVEGIDSFHKKVLFITGECNTLIGEDYQKDHKKLFKKTEAVVIPGAGHLMFGEKPKESMQVIRKYLRERL